MASPHFVNKSWPLLQDPRFAFARFVYFVFLLFISDERHTFDEMFVWVHQSSVSHKNTEEKEPSYKGHDNISSFSGNASKELKEGEHLAVCSSGSHASLNNTPTLAFPSISTSDFQFNLEKASDIIVEVVEEYVNKLGSARLVLVDVSHKSKILSLVKTKAAQKNIELNKFFTFVGDITKLYSEGGLRCNVIANAANW